MKNKKTNKIEKFIFLDVDGVLNSNSFFEKNKNLDLELDEEAIKRLQIIVNQTNAKIVLSSSWRELRKENPYRILLEKTLHKFQLKIYEDLPKYENVYDRPNEIYEYLKNYPNCKWVSIEDDWTIEEYKKSNLDSKKLIQTSFYEENGGLLDEHIPLAIQLLNE